MRRASATWTWLGALLGAAALLAVLVPVSQGRENGWPWWAVASLAAAPVLLAAFLLHARRHQAGLAFAPLGIGFALASAVAPRLSRWGAAVPAASAAVVACALGVVVLVAVAAPVERQTAFLAVALLIAGIGQGLAVNPVIALVLADPPDVAAYGPALAWSSVLLAVATLAALVIVVGRLRA